MSKTNDDDKITLDNIESQKQELAHAVSSGTINYQDLQTLLQVIDYKINELEQKNTGDNNTDKSSDGSN